MKQKSSTPLIVIGMIIATGLIVGAAIAYFVFSKQGTTTTGGQTPETPLNLGGDPFGAPPKGTSPNCGPEDRYKFDAAINSKEDFVNFIKTQEINQWVRLDNFKDESSGEVKWNKVLDAVDTEQIGSRTIYSVEYTPSDCSPAQKFILKITNDGHVSVYGCCGK